jgi:hypothetical protein
MFRLYISQAKPSQAVLKHGERERERERWHRQREYGGRWGVPFANLELACSSAKMLMSLGSHFYGSFNPILHDLSQLFE